MRRRACVQVVPAASTWTPRTPASSWTARLHGQAIYLLPVFTMGQTHDTPPAADSTGKRSLPALTNEEIHDVLAQRQCIAIILSSNDLREIRPDLNADQCLEVLEAVERHYDVQGDIEYEAEALFGPAPTGYRGESQT